MAAAGTLCVYCFAFSLLAALLPCPLVSSTSGGWQVSGATTSLLDENDADAVCNIERHSAEELSVEEFLDRYAFQEPVIIVHNEKNAKFKELCKRDNLLVNYGDKNVTLSTANTYSYTKVKTTLKEYIQNFLKPQRLDTLGNESLYLFGDTEKTDWQQLFENYEMPSYLLPSLQPELSFGIAGAGTGVPFHFHGPGFGEVIYGRKRWFLYPFEQRPYFDPDQSTLQWFLESYPLLSGDQKPLECVLRPNEVIYFPDHWWHSTLNLENTVFMSTFFGPTT